MSGKCHSLLGYRALFVIIPMLRWLRKPGAVCSFCCSSQGTVGGKVSAQGHLGHEWYECDLTSRWMNRLAFCHNFVPQITAAFCHQWCSCLAVVYLTPFLLAPTGWLYPTSACVCWRPGLDLPSTEAQPHAQATHPGSDGPPLGHWKLDQETNHSPFESLDSQPVTNFGPVTLGCVELSGLLCS